MTAAQLRWFFFTVIPAFVPFGWLGWKLAALHKFSIVEIFCRGELLIACSAFAATGIGDLLVSGKRYPRWKLVVGGSCLAALMLSIGNYVDLGLWVRQGIDYDKALYAWGSIGLCGFCMICGAACIRLAGYK